MSAGGAARRGGGGPRGGGGGVGGGGGGGGGRGGRAGGAGGRPPAANHPTTSGARSGQGARQRNTFGSDVGSSVPSLARISKVRASFSGSRATMVTRASPPEGTTGGPP